MIARVEEERQGAKGRGKRLAVDLDGKGRLRRKHEPDPEQATFERRAVLDREVVTVGLADLRGPGCGVCILEPRRRDPPLLLVTERDVEQRA